MSEGSAANAKTIAKSRARKVGVNLDVDNAWHDGDADVQLKVFGPDPDKDNIHQVLPQPNLHGMDEGLVQKTNLGVVLATIEEAKRLHKIPESEV